MSISREQLMSTLKPFMLTAEEYEKTCAQHIEMFQTFVEQIQRKVQPSDPVLANRTINGLFMAAKRYRAWAEFCRNAENADPAMLKDAVCYFTNGKGQFTMAEQFATILKDVEKYKVRATSKTL